MTENKSPSLENNAGTNGHSNEESNNNSSKSPKSILKIRIPDPNYKDPLDVPEIPAKKKRRDKSDLGDDFVAPDGGWGWIVAIASGVNILTTFALAQQFGIVFREHMRSIGITDPELTTIINTQIAVSAFIGLLNGPLFRRFTYRQVAVFGSFLTFLGLFFAAFSPSFICYVLSYSCCYGIGRGLTVSASQLAVNTYFKQKRRTATAYQFGVAGMGPIFLPFLATYLLDFCGVKGTVLIFSAISLNTIACSLVYQPVIWHVKKLDKDAEALNKQVPEEEEEMEHTADPEMHLVPFGSRTSLPNTPTFRNRLGTWDKQRENGTELKRLNSSDYCGKQRSFSVSHSIKEEEYEVQHEHDSEKDEKRALNDALHQKIQAEFDELERAERKKMPFYKKIIIFFDLDLLRDFTYCNLAIGLTLINFVEVNFAILTPFILFDFGFDKDQIALAMSLLGAFDLIIRFLIPLITAKMNFTNKTFFVFGIIGMCIGRAFLAFTTDYYFMIAIFVWLGLNKAFRTVFWSLIIAGYVPLKRLPAAAGLQQLISGVFSLACGPLLGVVQKKVGYAITLNVLNSLCILAVIMWIAEDTYRYYQRKRLPSNTNNGDAK